MKRKIKIIVIILLIAAVAAIIIMNVSTKGEEKVENESEIQPEAAINEKEEETQVTLYYIDNTSGVLTSQKRNIDAKNLIDNPYLTVLNELLNGPYNDENLKTEIPKETKVNSTKFEKGTLTIDLSSDFLNYKDLNAIYQIVNTETEFTEVEKVKITIDGEEQNDFKDPFVRR